MKNLSRFSVSLKALLQLGPRPLALYALYKFGLVTGHYKRVTPIINARKPKIELSNFTPLFSLPDRERLKEILGDEGQRALIKEADEIVGGKFRMFGGEPVEIKLTGNWPQVHWTEYETGKVWAQYVVPIQNVDLKFIWEPARFGWAFVLGRAYHVTQDNQYAEAFWKYFESFTEANPANIGPHWMNGQEVAIRMMSLVWAAHVFETASATSAERSRQLIQSIYSHAMRIPPTLVYARSQNNNHLLTEAAAIYTAGLLFKNPKWRALGWQWLDWSFQNQIGSYGEYIQHSVNYHRVMLQTALWINLIKQDAYSASTSQALARSAHWLFSLLDNDSGRTPNLGANDGALIFPLSVTPFNDFRPTVQAAARAFLRTQIESGVWDEMSLWLGLPPVKKTHDPEHYLTDHLRGRDSWAYLRASGFHSRLSHMDQLHLDLWWHGLNIAQDAGTYLYNAEPPWDNPLVRTRVHNTVTVDGRDQMTRGGRFLTLDWANAYSKPEISADENVLQRVKAYHKGYRGVRHERIVTVFTDERWFVEDRMISHHPHLYRLHWLLPDWEWEAGKRESGVRIRLKSPSGWITLNITSNSRLPNNESRYTLIRAGELKQGEGNVLPFEGWVSSTYGTKLPALSFAVEVSSTHFITFTSEFIFPK